MNFFAFFIRLFISYFLFLIILSILAPVLIKSTVTDAINLVANLAHIILGIIIRAVLLIADFTNFIHLTSINVDASSLDILSFFDQFIQGLKDIAIAGNDVVINTVSVYIDQSGSGSSDCHIGGIIGKFFSEDCRTA